MTCMMFKDTAMIKPYYAVPEKYTMFPKRPETIGLREIVTLPEYKVENIRWKFDRMSGAHKPKGRRKDFEKKN
jgi:hypothetical protein